MDKKTDPCEDTKYIVFATEPKPTHEVDTAVGHLQVCKTCRSTIPVEDRAKFVSGAARGRQEIFGGNNNAAAGSGSKATRRVQATKVKPLPHEMDEPEAS